VAANGLLIGPRNALFLLFPFFFIEFSDEVLRDLLDYSLSGEVHLVAGLSAGEVVQVLHVSVRGAQLLQQRHLKRLRPLILLSTHTVRFFFDLRMGGQVLKVLYEVVRRFHDPRLLLPPHDLLRRLRYPIPQDRLSFSKVQPPQILVL